jgi:uncharacterized SAM-binding protein YcdF (DUF218 family)
MPLQSVNVVTENTHARRTRLLFREALGKNVVVGIIAIANPDYDKGHWWRYSEGVAISSTASPLWPLKPWAYYDELKNY